MLAHLVENPGRSRQLFSTDYRLGPRGMRIGRDRPHCGVVRVFADSPGTFGNSLKNQNIEIAQVLKTLSIGSDLLQMGNLDHLQMGNLDHPPLPKSDGRLRSSGTPRYFCQRCRNSPRVGSGAPRTTVYKERVLSLRPQAVLNVLPTSCVVVMSIKSVLSF